MLFICLYLFIYFYLFIIFSPGQKEGCSNFAVSSMEEEVGEDNEEDEVRV